MSKKMGNKLTKLIAFACIYILHANLSFALENDSSEPLELKANSADINQGEHTGKYIGEIEFDQGTTHIRADKAITQTDANNKLSAAIIYGNKTNQAHYWSNIAKDKPALHAYADIIKYYPDKKIIELIGNARIEQGENLFTAPKIIYDIQKQHIVSTSMQNNKQKTIIIFHPPRKK